MKNCHTFLQLLLTTTAKHKTVSFDPPVPKTRRRSEWGIIFFPSSSSSFSIHDDERRLSLIKTQAVRRPSFQQKLSKKRIIGSVHCYPLLDSAKEGDHPYRMQMSAQNCRERHVI